LKATFVARPSIIGLAATFATSGEWFSTDALSFGLPTFALGVTTIDALVVEIFAALALLFLPLDTTFAFLCKGVLTLPGTFLVERVTRGLRSLKVLRTLRLQLSRESTTHDRRIATGLPLGALGFSLFVDLFALCESRLRLTKTALSTGRMPDNVAGTTLRHRELTRHLLGRPTQLPFTLKGCLCGVWQEHETHQREHSQSSHRQLSFGLWTL
tara:strand:- start:2322 stop:2960 length:639 start_codon:yes stop_codon:yes gene_type:complete